MKVSGYILKFGEEFAPGVVIGKDCKIKFADQISSPSLLKNETFKIDDIGVHFEGEVDSISMGVGGMVAEQVDNVIKSFKITEVNIIPVIKK